MKYYKLILLMVAVIVTMGSCKKYLDINSNPVNPQEPNAEYMLAPLIFQMANGTSQDYGQLFRIVQYWGGTSANNLWERHSYDQASDAGGVIWRMTYINHGLNLEDVINDGIKNQKYEFAGIGYAIKAWSYQMATDLHGPIILDKAFDPSLLAFPYQDQPDVYAKVREWTQLSLKYLDMKSPVDYSGLLKSASGDNIYGGDLNKWKKFNYALLALQYSHLVNKPEFLTSYADSVVKYVDLSFANTSEDATIFFTASNSDDGNPFGPSYGVITASTNGRISQSIVSLLTGGVRGTAPVDTTASVDPRLTRMLTPISTGAYRGNIPTKGSGTSSAPHVLGNLSGTPATYTGKYIFADRARYPLMSYAQLQFAKAEALFLKGDKAAAYTTYLGAIRAHMSFVNTYGRNGTTNGVQDPAITETEIAAYMASKEVAESAADLKISDIMQQKYIAQWGWAGLEQWSDLRKYHYNPEVFKTFYQLSATELFSFNNGKYAYRFRPRYNSEYVWNSKELEKWGGLNTDYMTKETWFSIKP
jgi:hypothetical protein